MYVVREVFMPIGLTGISVLFLLEVCGCGERLCLKELLKMRHVPLSVLLGVLTASYFVPPLKMTHTEVYWLPYSVLAAYAVYLLSKLEKPTDTLVNALIMAVSLRVTSLIVPVQPCGVIYEPYAVYTAVACALSAFVSNDASEAVFHSLSSFLIFAFLLLFSENVTEFFAPKMISAIVVTAFVGMLPSLVKRRMNKKEAARIVKIHRFSIRDKKSLEK